MRQVSDIGWHFGGVSPSLKQKSLLYNVLVSRQTLFSALNSVSKGLA